MIREYTYTYQFEETDTHVQTVKLSVNVDQLAHILGNRALKSKGGKSAALKGAVKAKVINRPKEVS